MIVPVLVQAYTNETLRQKKKKKIEKLKCSVLLLLGNRLKPTFWIIPKLGGNQKR